MEIYHDPTVENEQNIIKSASQPISIMSGSRVEIDDESGNNIAVFT